MKPTHKITLLTALLVALGLNSCNLNSDPDNGAIMFYADIVSSHLQPDSTLYFEPILTNDRGSVMLYPSPAIKAPISEGARTFIQYSIFPLFRQVIYSIKTFPTYKIGYMKVMKLRLGVLYI